MPGWLRIEGEQDVTTDETGADVAADELIAARRNTGGPMPDDMPRWMALAITGIDRFSGFVGQVVAWLVVPLMLAMAYEIAARYLFRAPTLWAFDTSRMLYGAYFILGSAYALSKGVHLRADFIYQRYDVRVQGAVDAALYILFFFPALIVFLYVAYNYAAVAVLRGERGVDTAWMPLLGPIKSALPLGIAFLLIQGVSEVLKSLYAARTGRWV